MATRLKNLLLLAGCLLGLAALADDKYVKPAGTPLWPFTNWTDAATNIQDAANAASAGETVWVTNGTYYCGSNSAGTTLEGNIITSMVTVAKAITIQSMNGPEVTIVDANYPGFTNRCFFLSAGAAVSGFTITNGHPNDIAGAGGVCIKGSGRLTNCWITGNMATNGYSAYYIGGGGVWCDRGGEVLNCRIYGNVVTNVFNGFGGAGLFSYGSGTTYAVRDCVISNNYAYYNNNLQGYAVFFRDPFASAVISNCTVIDNKGGGISINNSGTSPWTMDNCRIIGNSSRGTGAGLSIGGSGGITRNCRIIDNVALENDAGGVYISGGMMSNCVVSSNYTVSGAGGVKLSGSATVVQNCTIVSNYAAGAGNYGGGVNMSGGILRNCLIASNFIPTYGGGLALSVSAGTTARVENCTIVNNRGTYSGIYNIPAAGAVMLVNTICYSNFPVNWYSLSNLVAYNSCATNAPPGSGNITNAPDFVDYAGFNFRLNPGSPCVNAGTNQDWMADALDLDGHSRINPYYGNIVDIGAYEYIPALTIYIVH